MPTKIETETQILRKLSNTPLQIEIDLLQTISHQATHVPAEHLASFYRSLDDVRSKRYDGMIITGAPVERMRFEDVDYWPELCEIMEWTKTNVFSTFYICWGAQAGAYYHFGIPKYMLEEKMTGVFEHQILKPSSPLVRGLDDVVYAPHSRNTEVRAEDIAANPDLELIAVSDEAGVFIAKSTDSRHFFIFGHPEYDSDTLAGEYFRDLKKEGNAPLPKHYFPNVIPPKSPFQIGVPLHNLSIPIGLITTFTRQLLTISTLRGELVPLIKNRQMVSRGFLALHLHEKCYQIERNSIF